jgi:acyl-CoA thioester hydrolase
MPAVYEYHHTVAADEIDAQGHANNVAYVEWMQAAAISHSAAHGWPGERYRKSGCGWVVRSHWIEYRQPALPGQRIVVRTWVATMTKVSSARRYEIVRADDQEILAVAETKWAFIDYATGRPTRIPEEVISSFPLVDRSYTVEPPKSSASRSFRG